MPALHFSQRSAQDELAMIVAAGCGGGDDRGGLTAGQSVGACEGEPSLLRGECRARRIGGLIVAPALSASAPWFRPRRACPALSIFRRCFKQKYEPV